MLFILMSTSYLMNAQHRFKKIELVRKKCNVVYINVNQRFNEIEINPEKNNA